MPMTLRHLLLSTLVFSASLAAQDFSQSAQPALVFVTQSNCRFCVRLDRQVLSPLKASGLFNQGVTFVEVSLDAGEFVTDHDGLRVEGQAFAARYGAFGTPTLLFLDAQGVIQGEPWFGVPDALDFYGAKIEGAVAHLKGLTN